MLEMNPEVRREWCKALRSGEYAQTQCALRVESDLDGSCSYCCLGVLTDLYIKAGHSNLVKRRSWDDTTYEFDVWEDGTLTDVVQDWAGLGSSNPTLSWGPAGGPVSAVYHNDELRNTFAEIADLIDDGEGRTEREAPLA